MTNPTMTDTYRKIAARLTMFRPQIDLTKYFAGANPDVGLYGEKPYIREQLKKYGVAAATNTLLPGRHGFGLGRDRGQWSDAYSAQFGKDPQPQDITSLHFAVAADRVNVHIDETGFVFEGAYGALTVGPNFGHHAGNELFWKTSLPLPRWAAEHIDLILPNSANDFSRVGISVDMYRRKDLRVTVTGSCGIFGGLECSSTVSISGTHDLLSSKPKGTR